MNIKEELQTLMDAVKENKSPEEQQKIMDSWSPETKEHFEKTLKKSAVDNMTASQKYDAISKALKDEKTPESSKMVLEEALKELKPLIYREQKIGTIGDRYPDSVVTFRFLGIVGLIIGLLCGGYGLLIDNTYYIGTVGFFLTIWSLSFLSSTRKKLPR